MHIVPFKYASKYSISIGQFCIGLGISKKSICYSHIQGMKGHILQFRLKDTNFIHLCVKKMNAIPQMPYSNVIHDDTRLQWVTDIKGAWYSGLNECHALSHTPPIRVSAIWKCSIINFHWGNLSPLGHCIENRCDVSAKWNITTHFAKILICVSLGRHILQHSIVDWWCYAISGRKFKVFPLWSRRNQFICPGVCSIREMHCLPRPS